jgi:DNA repair protein RAD57
VAAAPTEGHDRKRQRSDEDDEDAVLVVVRRLTIVFSSVCAPASVDFIVTSRGVETLARDLGNAPVPPPPPPTNATAAHALAANVGVRPPPPLAEVSPLDVGSVVSDFRPPQQPGEIPVGEVAVEEDEDAYWREVDDFPFSGDSIDLIQGLDPSGSKI